MIEKVGVPERKITKQGKIYRLSYRGSYLVTAIKEWLYQDSSIFLERKKEKFDSIKKRQRGATYSKRSNKWLSKIMVNRKAILLGSFLTKQEALLAYNEFVEKNKLPIYLLNKI